MIFLFIKILILITSLYLIYRGYSQIKFAGDYTILTKGELIQKSCPTYIEKRFPYLKNSDGWDNQPYGENVSRKKLGNKSLEDIIPGFKYERDKQNEYYFPKTELKNNIYYNSWDDKEIGDYKYFVMCEKEYNFKVNDKKYTAKIYEDEKPVSSESQTDLAWSDLLSPDKKKKFLDENKNIDLVADKFSFDVEGNSNRIKLAEDKHKENGKLFTIIGSILLLISIILFIFIGNKSKNDNDDFNF
jgi:hypothetical protein